MEGIVIRRIIHYIFVEDYVAKIICFIIGCGLWFYVEFARVSQTTLNIPVEYVKKPANLYLKQGQPRFIKVTVRGRDEFLKFSTTGIKAEVNLANARGGDASYPVVFDVRQLPERVELAAKPDALSVGLEAGASKVVPVRVMTNGTPDAAWKIQKINVVPQQIEIDGPEAVIGAMQSLDTETVDVEGASKTINRKINLRIPDQVSTDKTRSVTVRVDFMPKTFSEEIQFEQIPLRIQNLDAALNAALSDTVVQVQLQGESSAVKKLKASDIYIYVNAEDTRFNSRTGSILPYANESGVPVKGRVLNGSKKVQIVSITPDKVNIRFTVKPEYSKKNTEGNN